MNEYNINDILRVASENTKKDFRQVRDRFYNGLKQEDELPPMCLLDVEMYGQKEKADC